MFSEPFAQAVFIGSTILSLVGGAIVLGGASIYDARQIRAKKPFLAHPRPKQYRYKPQISVIVYVSDPKSDVAQCLASIVKSSYTKYQIIIADNHSKADLKEVLAQFRAKHPKKDIRLVAKRRKSTEKAAIKSALRYAKGDVIIVIRSENALAKDSLQNATGHFRLSDVEAVIPSALNKDFQTDINLLAQFRSLGSVNGLKTLNLVSNMAGGVGMGVFYKKELLKNKPRQFKYKYASDVTIYTPPLYGISQALWETRKNRGSGFYIKVPLIAWIFKYLLVLWKLIIIPLFLGYGLYIALFSRYPALIVISWLMLSAYLMFSIWASEQISRQKKLRLLAYVPVAYVLFFVMAFAEPISKLLKMVLRPVTKLSRYINLPGLRLKKAAASR